MARRRVNRGEVATTTVRAGEPAGTHRIVIALSGGGAFWAAVWVGQRRRRIAMAHDATPPFRPVQHGRPHWTRGIGKLRGFSVVDAASPET